MREIDIRKHDLEQGHRAKGKRMRKRIKGDGYKETRFGTRNRG